MRPMDKDKLHGVVHDFKLSDDKAKQLADLLGITGKAAERLKGRDLYIGSHAGTNEIKSDKQKNIVDVK